MYDFHNNQHVADYLTSSVVSLKGQPVYVVGVYDDDQDTTGDQIRVQVQPLPFPHSIQTVKVGSLDFKPLTLGMCNLIDRDGAPAEAAYIVRIPARRWKIGLSRYGLYAFPSRQPDERGEYHPWLNINGPDHATFWLTEQPGWDMMHKDYPSFDQSKEFMEPYERRSCAFSPNFSITARGMLMYRFHNAPVGKAGHAPVLYNTYQALTEVLEEDINGEQ